MPVLTDSLRVPARERGQNPDRSHRAKNPITFRTVFYAPTDWLRLTRALPLLAGTTLAGRRASGSTATAAVPRAGTYILRARIAAAKLVRGRTYVVTLTAAGAGARRTLTLRVRA